MFKYVNALNYVYFFVCLFLVGCGGYEDFDYYKPAQANKEKSFKSARVFDKQIIMAGIGGVRNLPFFNLISQEDKILLETNLQQALDENDWREWQGSSVRCNIEIGPQSKKKLVLENETYEIVSCEFKQTFFIDSKVYVVANKACKVFVGQGKDLIDSFWILESYINDYLIR